MNPISFSAAMARPSTQSARSPQVRFHGASNDPYIYMESTLGALITNLRKTSPVVLQRLSDRSQVIRLHDGTRERDFRFTRTPIGTDGYNIYIAPESRSPLTEILQIIAGKGKEDPEAIYHLQYGFADIESTRKDVRNGKGPDCSALFDKLDTFFELLQEKLSAAGTNCA